MKLRKEWWFYSNMKLTPKKGLWSETTYIRKDKIIISVYTETTSCSKRKKWRDFFITTLNWSQSMHITSSSFLISLCACISSISVFIFPYHSHHISAGVLITSHFCRSTDHMGFFLFVHNYISNGRVKLLKKFCSGHLYSYLCIVSANRVALSQYLLHASSET